MVSSFFISVPVVFEQILTCWDLAALLYFLLCYTELADCSSVLQILGAEETEIWGVNSAGCAFTSLLRVCCILHPYF